MTRRTTDVGEAARCLSAGGVVARPTETVYGLAAVAHDDAAVQRVFAIKGRPADHPLIVHLASADQLGHWARRVPASAATLTAALWPGPLTVLVERAAHVPDVVTGGRATVGLRVPAHPMALALLAAVGDGVAAPSANVFGRVSPTTADHVLTDLGDAVDLVLDGGPCRLGVESTIVDCTADPPVLLRPGGVPVEQLDEVLGRPVTRHDNGPSRAPGMLPSHYAPMCAVVLASSRDDAVRRVNAAQAAGRRAGIHAPEVDAASYARGLYAALRQADEAGLDMLVVVPPLDQGIGAAVNDRLRRAAHSGPAT